MFVIVQKRVAQVDYMICLERRYGATRRIR